MPRIAQVCPRFDPYIGGVETHVREISLRLSNLGFDVEVLSTDASGSLPKETVFGKVKVRRFKSWAPGEAYHFSGELRSFLKQNYNSYDIVHGHSYHALPAFYAALAKSETGHFLFTPHYHGTGHTMFRRLLHVPYRFAFGRRTFSRAERIICVSEYERELVNSRFKIPAGKISVIPNGVSLSEFQQFSQKKKLSRERAILYVGRLERYKNVDVLVRALGYLDDASLWIVGKGPLKDDLTKLASELKLGDRVFFFEDLSREDLLKKYFEASVLCLLSEKEAYGIVIAEALAAGTPCVVANRSALTQWVDGENCIGLDNPKEPREVARPVREFIESGRIAVKPRLNDWNETASELAKVYDELLVKKVTPSPASC
jgi:1,2-diacylglycerol 3-alpha-glucosyltransferase